MLFYYNVSGSKTCRKRSIVQNTVGEVIVRTYHIDLIEGVNDPSKFDNSEKIRPTNIHVRNGFKQCFNNLFEADKFREFLEYLRILTINHNKLVQILKRIR